MAGRAGGVGRGAAAARETTPPLIHLVGQQRLDLFLDVAIGTPLGLHSPVAELLSLLLPMVDVRP